MIRRALKGPKGKTASKIDAFLEKYHLPKGYFGTNRRSMTRGIAVGWFWGSIPMPFQMVGAMSITPFMKFNVPIAIAVVWLSNPLTYPAIFYGEYLIGNLILGREAIEGIELTMSWFHAHWGQIATSLYVGAFFVATVVNAVVYAGINWLWIRSVKYEKHHREAQRRARKALDHSPSQGDHHAQP
jgi:uncharacterized protein (DUF2062 family)